MFSFEGDNLAFSGESSLRGLPMGRRLWIALWGEERPRNMLLLLTTLVVLLHVWLLTWLMRPVEQTTEAVPLVMEVSMISISVPKPEPAPPKPVPPPPKPQPKKPKPKPVVKKPEPVVQKAPDFAPVEKIEPPPVEAASASNSATDASTTARASTTETFTEANFRANYAHNPKPRYPPIAKRRGWQGKVLLRVRVSAQGLSDSVAVEKSSGHEMLDEAAVEAVKKWRFIPAKRGSTPVASTVTVPILFNLRN